MMNSAEFKTIREAIGLTVSNVANIGNVSERTVRYWESGRNIPPQDISNKLLEIDTKLEHSVNEALKIYVQKPQNKVILYRYISDIELHEAHPDFIGLPVTVHASLLYRIKHKLQSLSVSVSIEYK